MHNLKIALYAASEGGKTVQIGNLIDEFGVENVGIISCEDGLGTIRSKTDPKFIKVCENLDDVRAAWGWAKENFGEGAWVCCDGASRVLQWVRDEYWLNAERAMELLMEGTRREMLPNDLKPYARFVTKGLDLDGQRIWISVGTACERLLDGFIKLPSNTLWTFWEELTNTDQYTKSLPYKPDTPGNGAFQAIKRSFDYVFRLTRDGETIVAQCANSTKAFAKRRDDWNILKVPPEIKPFNLAEFVKLLRAA